MFSFIIANLNLVLLAVGALISVGYAAWGIRRSPGNEADDIPARWSYKVGHWKKATALAASVVPLLAAVAFVPRGYAGVVMDANNGVLEAELNPGLHFVVPFKQYATNINTQIQIYRHNDEKVFQHTFDTQEIRVPIAVNYKVNPDMADYVFSELAGGAFTIIEPALLRALRTAIGAYSLEDIAPNQVAITTRIEDEIRPQLERHGIEIVYVAIEDTIAKPGIIEAIEQERIAERNKKTAEHNRDIAVTTAEGTVATAKGDAESIRVIADAEKQRLFDLGMTPSEFVWYTRWNGALPQVILGEGSDPIIPIPDLPATAVEEE